MTPALALAAAGHGAVLVRRPTGVLHVYTGPLTVSGVVPRARRVVCRTRTRRLTAHTTSRGPSTRLCARCSAGLARGQAEQLTRAQVAARYSSLTPGDFLAALVAATAPADVEQVGLLALVVLGLPACLHDDVPTDPPRPLAAHVGYHRARVHGFPDQIGAQLAEHREAATARRRAERAAIWKDREARIERLGINNATRR